GYAACADRRRATHLGRVGRYGPACDFVPARVCSGRWPTELILPAYRGRTRSHAFRGRGRGDSITHHRRDAASGVRFAAVTTSVFENPVQHFGDFEYRAILNFFHR